VHDERLIGSGAKEVECSRTQKFWVYVKIDPSPA